MRRHLFTAGLAAAVLLPSAVLAQQTCEQRSQSRVAGTLVGAAAGRDNGLVGLLLSLGTQATLTALDTPDTRSWETLPARIAVARLRIPAGAHSVVLEARGVSRRQEVNVKKGGWAVVSLMALR